METNKMLFDYEVGENIDGFVLIKAAEARLTKNGKQFIAFTFADKSGEISAKFWDATDEDVATFQAGRVIHLTGKRENYQDSPQVKIFGIRLAKDDEPNDPTFYLKSAPETAQEMGEALNHFISEIKVPEWQGIVCKLLKKYHDEFLVYPAAKKNHHAYSGGLAYHTLSILRLAQTIISQYEGINASLLYAGIILHDLGKIKELTGPISTSYTLAGNLIGHISLMDEEIFTAAKELGYSVDSEKLVLLRHMVLSHHGLLEYGSPVRPQIIEAEILHQLDNLDASIQMMRGALEHAEVGEFSERIFGLDNRQFLKHE